MLQSPFHAYYTARKLDTLTDEALLPAFASSDIAVYPYQIAAAQLALRAQYQKGVILCDEGSLGKTYVALIIAAQLWYQGKDRQLLVLPVGLIRHWTDKLQVTEYVGFTERIPHVLSYELTPQEKDLYALVK